MYEQIANNEIENIMEKTRKMLGIAPEEYKIAKMKDIGIRSLSAEMSLKLWRGEIEGKHL